MITLDFTGIISKQIAAIQAVSNTVTNFTVGSILRAVVEASSSIAMWLQNLLLQILAQTRAATCVGADLDSWMADFELTRVTAIASSGTVTFARFTSTTQALIPIDSVVEMADGSVQFSVVEDASNVNYSESQQSYLIPIGTSSIDVPVVCKTSGLIGNIAAGSITMLTQSISGIDTVTNATTFVNGADTETDDAFRERFITYLSSLRKATRNALSGVIAAVQAGLSFNIVENYNFDGTPNDGYFYVVVDDGTGNPSSTLLEAISAAVEECRPLTSAFGVFAPTVQLVNVTYSIVVSASLPKANSLASAKAAVQNYINSLGLGATLSYTTISKVIYASDPNILDVQNVTVNSGVGNITPFSSSVLKAGTIVGS